jgi:hypothetical protein
MELPCPSDSLFISIKFPLPVNILSFFPQFLTLDLITSPRERKFPFHERIEEYEYEFGMYEYIRTYSGQCEVLFGILNDMSN